MNKWMMLLLMAALSFSTADAQTKVNKKKAVSTRKVTKSTRKAVKKTLRKTKFYPPTTTKCGVIKDDKPAKNDANRAFDVVEEMPEFPGGMKSLMEYLMENIHYPADCQENSIQGRVVVQFIVERDGSITDAKVMRSLHSSLDKEALRVVNHMPKWKPGKMKGESVRVKFMLPIAFRLK